MDISHLQCCYFMLGGRNPGLPRSFMYAFNVLWLTLVAASVILGSLVHQGYYFISIGCVMLIVITCASYSIQRTCSGRRLLPMVAVSGEGLGDPFFGPPPPYETVMVGQADEPPNYVEALRINSMPKESLPANVESELLLSNESEPTTVQIEK